MKKLTKDVFTTGEVAKICNVSLRTVIKWFDKGIISGYIIPGTKDRRIPRNDLMEFMKSHNIPFSFLEQITKGELLEYCWDFFARTQPERENSNCEKCLVYNSHTLQCYVLVSRLKQRGTSCAQVCDECDYYHNVWHDNGSYSDSIPDKEPCWEYYQRVDGNMHNCEGCIVYKLRASKCFEYSKIMWPDVNCKNVDCSSCSYYNHITEILKRESDLQ